MTPLSSSYIIPGVVPVWFYLFQACGLKPAKVKKFEFLLPVRGFFTWNDCSKLTKTNMITSIYSMARKVHSHFAKFDRYSDKQAIISDYDSHVGSTTGQTLRLVLMIRIPMFPFQSATLRWRPRDVRRAMGCGTTRPATTQPT